MLWDQDAAHISVIDPLLLPLLLLLLLCVAPSASKSSSTDIMRPHAGGCYVMHSRDQGLSSTLYVLIEGLTLHRTRCGGCSYRYNHSLSPYQCPGVDPSSGLSPFLATPLNPSASLTATWGSARGNGCRKHRHDLAAKDVIELIHREHDERMHALGVKRLALEFGVGLPPEVNAARIARQRQVHAASCAMVRDLWVLNPSFSATTVEPLRQRLGALKQPLVAIHIRGGDKLQLEVPKEEYLVPLLEKGRGPYAKGATQLLARHPEAANGTCVIVGDDWMLSMWVAATVRPILGCKVESHVLPDNKGHYQGSFNMADIDSRCESTKVLFSDIDLLAWAPYTIGTVHSNVDELALRIGMCVYGRKETTYLDAEDWDVVTVYPRVW